MSPAQARTSNQAVVAAARALLEDDGLEAVTMASVAQRVGVRPPSLYKRVRDRAALLDAIAVEVADELGATLASADPGASAAPEVRLRALADVYRDFARRSPRATGMLFTDFGPGSGEWSAANVRAVEPLLAVARALVGDARALSAARVAAAFVYGFTSMEAARAFRLGDRTDDAFDLGIEVITAGLRDSVERGATRE